MLFNLILLDTHADSNHECSCPPNFKLCINNLLNLESYCQRPVACVQTWLAGRNICERRTDAADGWALKWDLPVEFARHQGNPGYSGSARGAWNGIGQSELDLYNTAALGTAIYCFHLLFWSCFCVVQPLELSELHAELQQAVPRCESHCSDLSIYGCCEVGQIGNGRTSGHCGHWL